MASTETLDARSISKNSELTKYQVQLSPQIPPPRMDLVLATPSAPPLHLLQDDTNTKEPTLSSHNLTSNLAKKQ